MFSGLLGAARALLVVLVLGAMSVTPASAAALKGCPDTKFFTSGKFISDLCWDCIFPMTLAGVPLAIGRSTSNLPTGLAAPFCLCPGRTGYPSPGITMGMWMPTHIVEVVRRPFCLPTLGLDLGSQMTSSQAGMKIALQQGGAGDGAGLSPSSNDQTGTTFYNVHWLKFPTSVLMDMFENWICAPKGGTDMDYLFFQELNPLWQSDLLSLYVNPEAKIFAQVYAVALCMVDAVKSSMGRPIKQAINCLGSWGQMYPVTGHAAAQETVEGRLAAAARNAASMHRYTLAKMTYGNKAVCKERNYFVYPKHQYQWQHFWPLPTRSKAVWTGASAWRWKGQHRKYPGAEDSLEVQFTFKQCCITLW